jgi:hypothetical protein
LPCAGGGNCASTWQRTAHVVGVLTLLPLELGAPHRILRGVLGDLRFEQLVAQAPVLGGLGLRHARGDALAEAHGRGGWAAGSEQAEAKLRIVGVHEVE